MAKCKIDTTKLQHVPGPREDDWTVSKETFDLHHSSTIAQATNFAFVTKMINFHPDWDNGVDLRWRIDFAPLKDCKKLYPT
jgi:hypothetical protein